MRLKGPDHEYAVIIICGQQALTIEREGHLMLPSATCGKKVKPKEAAEEAIRAAAAIVLTVLMPKPIRIPKPKQYLSAFFSPFVPLPVPFPGLTSLLAAAAASGLRSGVRFSCAASQDR